MFDTFNNYIDDLNDDFNFTPAEWKGLIIAGNIAAAISFVANSGVLALHGFMLWYRPFVVNRLSLRMIVLSCIFNMIYCCCQLIIDDIGSLNTSCRALSITLIAADTMACMCLAMVGLNLVTIFVFKVSRSMKLEVLYYCFIGLSGIFVTVIPTVFGSQRGPKVREKITSCWYSLFFDGRISKPFNWMWYYGWLLFSLAFAAICAGISIRFVLKKQDNFAGTLDMFTRRSRSEVSQINTLRKCANSNTDIFTKIARRCICYPLVPLFSKSWGVAIEIAAVKKAYIPYEIFILDRVFSCLLGLMVSVIYFTDPAIGAMIQDFKRNIKKKFVFDYYTVKFQPSSDPTAQAKSQYPQYINIIPLSDTTSSDESNRLRTFYFENQTSEGAPVSDVGTSASATSGEPFIRPLNMNELQTIQTGHTSEAPALEVIKSRRNSDPDRRYSVISVTTKSGKIFLPNEFNHNNQINSRYVLCLPRSNVSIIPMRRVSEVKKTQLDGRRYRRAYSKNTETVEMLVPYKHPRAAKCLHWILTRIFKVKPNERRESTQDEQQMNSPRSNRLFFDYTESSNPGTPINLEPTNVSESDSHDGQPRNGYLSSPQIRSRYGISGSDNSLDLQINRTRAPTDEEIELHSIRRVTSINVASLYRNKIKKENRPLSLSSSTRLDERRSSHTLGSNSVFSNQLGISKLLTHGRSFNWNKLTQSGRRSNLSSPIDSISTFPIGDIEMKDMSAGSRLKENDMIVKDDVREESSSAAANKSVILAPFSSDLSPRPVVQYRKRILKRRLRKANQNSAPMRKPTSKSLLSTFGENDNYLLSLSLLYDGERNEYDVSDEEEMSPMVDDILQLDTLTLTPTDGLRPVPANDILAIPELKEPLTPPKTKIKSVSAKNVYEGFVEGITTIDYISNWQEDNNDEGSRIAVYSEPWDIEEQYKEQLEFTENILHI